MNVIADQQSLGPGRSTRGVCGLVRCGLQLATLPVSPIQAIAQRRDPDAGLVQLDAVAVDVGDRVRVFDGPLAGLDGIFREGRGSTRKLLLMSMLAAESTVEVDALLLQKAM